VLIVAPFGRDAESIASVLVADGLCPVIHRSLSDVAVVLGDDVGAVVVADEALSSGIDALQAALAHQPSWSDIPFVVLRSPRHPTGGKSVEMPTEVINLVQLERPMSSASLLSAMRSALRARSKQYLIRDQMIRLEQSQAALAASESELRLIADALPVLIAFVDTQLIYRFANLAYEEWFGMPVSAIIGHGVQEVVGAAMWEQRKDDIGRVLAGESVRAEVRLSQQDGQRRDAEIRYIPRVDGSGMVDGFHVFAVDITARIAALELTQQQASVLESRVAERTAALEAEMAARQVSEEALRQAQKMEAVGQLTGGIAHDFNNMLTGILASMELMRARVDDGTYNTLPRLIEIASTSAQRAAGLTQRLLAFSRRQSLDPKPVDMGALVRSMEDLLARTLGERVRLRTNVDEAVPMAMVDANQLESALLNLAINARDAMPDGGELDVATLVAALPEGEPGQGATVAPRYAVLSVRDTGVGMDETTLSRVFEPFFTTKPIGQGTGLGMSMIYGFVRQSQGHIRVTSTLGEGTTVCLYLPLADEQQLADQATGEKRVIEGGGQTILVVDDDAQVRMLVTELLEQLGYSVTVADSAEAALPVLASQGPFDLLITDVGLPGLNGRQLADLARQTWASLPVLFMTGYAHSALTRSEFLGPGMRMIGKPFTLAGLSEEVGAILAPG
jgi:PAS domain S-box-containing protein